jgi:hypothetical protein
MVGCFVNRAHNTVSGEILDERQAMQFRDVVQRFSEVACFRTRFYLRKSSIERFFGNVTNFPQNKLLALKGLLLIFLLQDRVK